MPASKDRIQYLNFVPERPGFPGLVSKVVGPRLDEQDTDVAVTDQI